MDWPLLDVLSAEERRSLLSMARRRRFRRGEVVFHEGDPGDALHLVDKGHLVVRRSTPLGDVATLLVLGPGDIFGELAVVAPAPRNATVAALDPVETLAVHQEVFEELRARHPSVDRGIARCLEGLVKVAAATGEFERAARLSGAAAALREAMGSPIPPSELADYQQAIGTARTALGEGPFRATEGAGRSTDLEAAIQSALDSTTTLRPVTGAEPPEQLSRA